MTSIEWLEGQILNLMSFDTTDFRKEFREKFEQAKEMHRKEIISAVSAGYDYNDEGYVRWMGEQYYQQTFKKD
jgi:hypothetical protein